MSAASFLRGVFPGAAGAASGDGSADGMPGETVRGRRRLRRRARERHSAAQGRTARCDCSLRTAASASLLPTSQVPVFSIADGEDFRIRGYTKCPTYVDRLTGWLGGEEFRRQEEASAALRSRVGELAPQLNTSLSNWWNVYDAFNVWGKYQVRTCEVLQVQCSPAQL